MSYIVFRYSNMSKSERIQSCDRLEYQSARS